MIFNFNKFPERAAIIEESGMLSYSDLERESHKIAENLVRRSLIFCLAENNSPSLAGYLGAINNGHVPLLLSSTLDNELLTSLITTYRPGFLWIPESRQNDLPEFSSIYSYGNYSLLKASYAPTESLHPQLALLLPTSGSTGSPKLVRHSYTNLLSNIAAIIEYLGVKPDHRAITSLPMHYTYGLSVINIHLFSGASVIMTGHSVLNNEFWKLFQDYGATSLSGVPYTWEMINRLGLQKLRLGELKYCDQAGGKMSPELQRSLIDWAQRTGRRFTVMYGQTEASPRMGYLPWERASEKYGRMGISIPGGKFRLLDERGDDISEPDSVGELIYEGPNVTMGYALNSGDLAKGDEWNGVLHTGDMAKMDEDGFYTIVGRKSRFLKIYGNRVNLDEAERILRKAFPDYDIACTGRDDEMIIYVSGEDCQADIIGYLSERTSLHPRAFKLKMLAAIPRSESGKIQYSGLE